MWHHLWWRNSRLSWNRRGRRFKLSRPCGTSQSCRRRRASPTTVWGIVGGMSQLPRHKKPLRQLKVGNCTTVSTINFFGFLLLIVMFIRFPSKVKASFCDLFTFCQFMSDSRLKDQSEMKSWAEVEDEVERKRKLHHVNFFGRGHF